MIERPFWRQRIEDAWREAPIAWLCGVRRSGKTTLAESLGAERTFYVNCDLPTVEEMVSDPQVFFRSCVKPVGVHDGRPRDKACHPYPSLPPSRGKEPLLRHL